mmetsp:Transcript_6066/g.20224  ORF Transcript_6066/g.20224 Transcript_6066/m.20224 type:complete len:201 (-) Transcript_6066:1019-1621(-)
MTCDRNSSETPRSNLFRISSPVSFASSSTHTPFSTNLPYADSHVFKGVFRSTFFVTAKCEPGYRLTETGRILSSRLSCLLTATAGAPIRVSPSVATRLFLEDEEKKNCPNAARGFWEDCFVDLEDFKESSEESSKESSTTSAVSKSAATARQHRDRCAAAAPALSPMMSSQPHRCCFHICTSSPGDRDCRKLLESTMRGW